jgi:hypothetical protein
MLGRADYKLVCSRVVIFSYKFRWQRENTKKMANKRMIAKQIIDSDAFLDMPTSSQLLYFHLIMRADDEGFVGNPKKIMREIGVGQDDFKILISKRFLLTFETGVIVIKHWLMHNAIRMDRFNPTSYQDEKKLLLVKENKSYSEWQPNGNHLATQVKLSKVKLRERASLSYLKDIPNEDLEEFYSKFDCDRRAIKSKAEALFDYCQSKGKVYKNYKAFLSNALRKDFKERKEPLQNRKVVMIDGKPTLIQK